MSSSLSSGIGYLFESFWSIWLKIAQHLVVNFVVFRREIDLQSFYSAILFVSYPVDSYLKHFLIFIELLHHLPIYARISVFVFVFWWHGQSKACLWPENEQPVTIVTKATVVTTMDP